MAFYETMALVDLAFIFIPFSGVIKGGGTATAYVVISSGGELAYRSSRVLHWLGSLNGVAGASNYIFGTAVKGGFYLFSQAGRNGEIGAAGSATDGLRELSWGETHAIMGTEKHHPVFRYLLRAFDKAGFNVRTPSGRMYPQKLVGIPVNQHQNIVHGLWDDIYPQLSRGLSGTAGGSDDIARMIRNGETTPTQILDELEMFYATALNDSPELLAPVLESLRALRAGVSL